MSVEAYCGAVRRDAFGVDLVVGSLMTSAPEVRTSEVLELRGLEPPVMLLYPVVDHVADKLCATQAGYGTGGERRSSRVRDLVDLVVLARTQDIDGAALVTALRGEWTHRGLAGEPVFDPPGDWAQRYRAEARRTPAVAEFSRFQDAVSLVGAFFAPALDGTASGLRWVAADLDWR